MFAVLLSEIEKQTEEILEHIDFIRENAGLPPFAGNRATPIELLQLVNDSVDEFKEFAEWHVPIYVGRCFIDELNGHWSIEKSKSSVMYGKPYVDGFGNIEYENLYLPLLAIATPDDVQRINHLWKQSRRAHELRERFRKEFGELSGTTASVREIEARCVELEILPKNSIRFKVDRARVPLYCRELHIRLAKR